MIVSGQIVVLELLQQTKIGKKGNVDQITK